MLRSFILALSLVCSNAWAHQMTPTYPKLRLAIVEGILETTVTVFNRRPEVEYYEIAVYDENWNPITFATESRLIQLKYLEKKSIDVYIQEKDKGRVKYICTTSKIEKSKATETTIYSRICSKIK